MSLSRTASLTTQRSQLACVCLEGIEERSGLPVDSNSSSQAVPTKAVPLTVGERLREARAEVKSGETAVRAMGVRKVRGIVKEFVEVRTDKNRSSSKQGAARMSRCFLHAQTLERK